MNKCPLCGSYGTAGFTLFYCDNPDCRNFSGEKASFYNVHANFDISDIEEVFSRIKENSGVITGFIASDQIEVDITFDNYINANDAASDKSIPITSITLTTVPKDEARDVKILFDTGKVEARFIREFDLS